MNKLLTFACFSFALASCSNKDLYNAGQQYQKSECINQAGSEQQYNDCNDRDKKSYDEYEQERKEVITKE